MHRSSDAGSTQASPVLVKECSATSGITGLSRLGRRRARDLARLATQDSRGVDRSLSGVDRTHLPPKPLENALCGRFAGTELVFCAIWKELTCDESNLCGRHLRWSDHQSNQHGVSAIRGAVLWPARRLLLLWFARRPLLRPAADEFWLGLHTQSAHGRWRTLSCLANG